MENSPKEDINIKCVNSSSKSIEKKDEIISHDLNSVNNLAFLFEKVLFYT